MGRLAKLRQTILAGKSDTSIRFAELRRLLIRPGFEERVKGDHHIFARADIAEIINLQPKGNEAKAYQVKQVRNLLVKYGLGDIDVDQVRAHYLLECRGPIVRSRGSRASRLHGRWAEL